MDGLKPIPIKAPGFLRTSQRRSAWRDSFAFLGCGPNRHRESSLYHLLNVQGKISCWTAGCFRAARQDTADINSHLALTPDQLGGKVPPPLNAVVLSHAHIDHSGDLRLLATQGYRGPVNTTPATIDLCLPMLKDSAHIQEGDAEFINKRRGRHTAIKMPAGAPPMMPLYTQDDAAQLQQLFRPVKTHEPQLLEGSTIDSGFTMVSINAGHMLGSTCVLLEAMEKGQTTRLLFSGDVGRKNLPIIKDPDQAPPADYLIMESTYGDRLHQPIAEVKPKVAALVNKVLGRGGHIIVPAFAVERTQQLVLMLHELIEAKQIPDFPMYVDSPLASAVTEVFKKHTEEWGRSGLRVLQAWRGRLRLEPPPLHADRSGEQGAERSACALYGHVGFGNVREPGRILHHLNNGIEDPLQPRFLITGYQARQTIRWAESWWTARRR